MATGDEQRAIPPEFGEAREQFLSLVAEVRPLLYRYCARITGSVVEGEDVVQETLAKAFYAMSMATELPPLRPWLFRIAHNTALDFLRRYEHKRVEPRDDLDEIAAGSESPDQEVVRAALGSFALLPVNQRCAVILKDVLGHSLDEAADTMGTTVPAVKAALVRGRAKLRASRTESPPSPRAHEGETEERERLKRYAALFNAKNWEALRALMAEECRLDLLSRASRRGVQVGEYFARYQAAPDVRLEVGEVEARPALLAFTAESRARPAYFILLEWTDDKVALIRDYRYVGYLSAELG
ncbi:MAG TPA: sigma-70 family RNA polymerase sigma factor [Polyangiaceae bacterium]|nr:sigma-70 family RNA polymerase sigma factor [Polyangiaceae bacterium]